jgi:hypothetical protein
MEGNPSINLALSDGSLFKEISLAAVGYFE